MCRTGEENRSDHPQQSQGKRTAILPVSLGHRDEGPRRRSDLEYSSRRRGEDAVVPIPLNRPWIGYELIYC